MWTLIIKSALVVAALALVAWLGALFLNIEGDAVVSFAGFEVAMRTSKLVLVLAALMTALWIVVALLRRGASWLLSALGWFAARRHAQGLDALAKAMAALAEGDGVKAVREADRAERLLDNPDLTRLVNAQAARLAGDEARAEAYFEAMATDRDTDFLGVMGLLRAALADKKHERALALAERAHALRPTKGEVIDILFDLQKRKGDWAGARATINAAVRAKRLTRDVADRRRAVLSVAEAEARERAGDKAGALENAMAALRLAPTLAPAAVVAARLHAERGEPRVAERRLAEAWRAEPHPSLAEAYAALGAEETPADRLKRFERLIRANASHPETKCLNAELALAAGDAEAARRAMGDALTRKPSARGYAIMAAIEQAQAGDQAVVRAWLAKAAAAPRDARWTCRACAATAQKWSHECGACGGFDTLEWRETVVDVQDGLGGLLTLVAADRAQKALPSGDAPKRIAAAEPSPRAKTEDAVEASSR